MTKYDQHNPPAAPEGKRAEWVRPFIHRGVNVPGKWRFVPIKRSKRRNVAGSPDSMADILDTLHAAANKPAVKHNLDAVRIANAMQGLNAPLGFLYGMQMMEADNPMIDQCIAAIELAQLTLTNLIPLGDDQ